MHKVNIHNDTKRKKKMIKVNMKKKMFENEVKEKKNIYIEIELNIYKDRKLS